MNDRLIKPKDLSKLFGVTTQTLTQWEADGKLQAVRTDGGHRRYVYPQTLYQQQSSGEKKKYIYARVSSSK
jgi:predicted site-specific integrase-resolvase